MGIYDGLLRVYRNLRLVHMNLRLVHMNLRLVHMNLRLVHMNALCFSSIIRTNLFHHKPNMKKYILPKGEHDTGPRKMTKTKLVLMFAYIL